MSEQPPCPERSQGPQGSDTSIRQVGQAFSLGMELVVPALLGWWLDNLFGWAPAGVLVGGAFGFLLVLVHASRLIEPDRSSRPDQTPTPPRNPEKPL